MNPEDYLKFVEGVEGLTDLLDRFKTSLEGKGWTAEGAEAGAISLYEVMSEQDQ